ncbi:FG-GAP repeat domain-containing protein [Tundrisphaera lichenicola]|uniref:FG-GAP repeat domain-containing protein n=1 Tax=Tundrisphaera lichenicola TaxID=2029860 RepID=UPI003EB9CA68
MDLQLRMTTLRRAIAGRLRELGLALGSLAALGGVSFGDDTRLADYYGFLPLEVYKVENRIGGLTVRDLDGDRVDDIAVVNNARSRIDLLLTTPRPEGEVAPAAADEVNQLPSDQRMRPVSVPVNKEIVSLQVGDFDGDGKLDLAYYGNPAGIEILYNRGNGRFGDVKKINTGEAVEASGSLTVGDLDRDGRDDLALLTKDEVVVIYQREKGKLAEPERLPHTLDNPRMIRAVDLDGNGVVDLVMLNGGPDDPIRVRFAVEGGRHGPEERFALEPLRAYAFGQVDGKPGSELLTIENQSGRTRVLTLGADEEGLKNGRLSFYPLPPGSEQGRSLDLGDLDGDGLADVVATDPARAQFVVHLQSGKAGLGESKTFPGLVGGGPIKLGDLDGDGKAEVYVVSEKEKQLGRSVLQDGRLTFPAPLPTSGDPVALSVADLDGDKTPEILYVTRDRAEGSTSDLFTLRALARDKSGTFLPFRWGPVDKVPLKGVGGVPPAITVVDVNRDNMPDVLVFDVYGPPLLLLGRAGEPPAPAAGGLGPLAGVARGGLSVTTLDGEPALIVAQQSFARKLLLDRAGQWAVQDQFDSGRASAQVQGASAIDLDGDGVKEIALLDRVSKSILFLSKKDGIYRPSGSLSVGPFEDFQGMRVADLDGDGRDDLLLAGTSRFGVVVTGKPGQKLRTLASYESPRNEARFGDLAVGDLNADGQPDVVLIDIAEHFIEMATYAGQPDLARTIAFKVFERKARRNAADLIEPRDLAIGDVDGDGRSDLVLIVHDRVLVYRQDPGPEKEKEKEPVKAADARTP